LPTSNTLLRTDWSQFTDFTDRNIISIDPIHSLIQNSPYDLIQAYRARTTICTSQQADNLCHDEFDCKEQSVIDATDTIASWAGLPRANNFLPFLPISILTGCVSARRSLAEGTIALWQEIGIYQDYEDATRLVNLLEHGSVLTTADGRQALFQFLHHIYHTTQTTFASREVEYVAAMSSIVFDFDNTNQVDVRAYKFLTNILTKVQDLTNEASNALAYATEPLGVPWDQYNPSQYTVQVQNIISQGANRTFGSTEFNTLSVTSQDQLINDKQNGTGSGGWTEFYPLNSTINNSNSGGAPPGVFLMTPTQFNLAQDLN